MDTLLSKFVRRYCSCPCGQPKNDPCSTIRREPCPSRLPPYDCLEGPSGWHPIPDGGYKKFSKLFLFVCLPLVIVLSLTVLGNPEHVERPKFFPYPFLRKRDKIFPWDGGSEKSFFHNPELNPLPNGYEDEI
ncbi:hypothetical protein FQR65_LT03860 [Abscondita terminalis]|nr:hypothetical protein FQR65_LT03860 [Abscondita terminalis]